MATCIPFSFSPLINKFNNIVAFMGNSPTFVVLEKQVST